jgi:hypothetical protein
MNNFDKLYEKSMSQVPTLDLKVKLGKKPLTWVVKDDQNLVFGYTKDGKFKELISKKNDITGTQIVRNFIYKHSSVDYYMRDNKKVKIPQR